MRIRLGELRRIVREGVFSDWMNTAGWCEQGSNIGHGDKGVVAPPPGLGSSSTEEDEERYDDEHAQEKSQVGARYADRHAVTTSRV